MSPEADSQRLLKVLAEIGLNKLLPGLSKTGKRLALGVGVPQDDKNGDY